MNKENEVTIPSDKGAGLMPLLCADCIDRVEDKSDENMARARVYFKNGNELSIVCDPYSFGEEDGLFEIMPSDESFFDDKDFGDSVCGYLSAERVSYYINKIGNLSA
jgi:hypothetical protein